MQRSSVLAVSIGVAASALACAPETFTSSTADAAADAVEDDSRADTRDTGTDTDTAPTRRHVPLGGVCDLSIECSDDDLCDGLEICDGGHCVAGTPPVIDDRDPCTKDSCTAAGGVRHDSLKDFMQCGLGCPVGYHVTSFSLSGACAGDSGTLNQATCGPDCGSSFTACGSSCPTGYHVTSTSTSCLCGSCTTPTVTCAKT